MKIIKFLFSLLVVCTLVLHAETVFAHGVVYETKPLEGSKVQITLKWSDPKEAKGLVISWFNLKNGKTLHIGYEIKDKAAASASMEYDLSSALPPIRIVLSRVNDLKYVPFKDIRGIEAEEYIRHLHDAGIAGGNPDGTYLPEKSISRAEFTAMLIQTLKLPVTAENSQGHKDIDEHWSKKFMLTAVKHNLVSGYKDKTLRPDKLITVGEVCSILNKAFTFKTAREGFYTKLNGKLWCAGAVRRMFDSGVLNPKDSVYENFNEGKSLSRADCAMMLSRALSTY